MKRIGLRILVAVCCLLCAFRAGAQDVLVTKSGDMIQAFDVDISDKYVYYKAQNATDASLLKVEKASLFMVKKQDGTSIVFGNGTSASPAPAQAQAARPAAVAKQDVSISPEANNALKEKYNVEVGYKPNAKELKKKGKKAKIAYFQLGVTSDAVLADQNVELEFRSEKQGDFAYNDFVGASTNWGIQVIVKNKTNRTLFVDLGNSFFIRGQEAAPYYIPSATSSTHGKSGGASVNLGAVANAFGVGGVVGSLAGGVNVGGEKSSAATTVTYSQRVISIPPMSSKKLDAQLLFLPDYKDVYEMKVFSCDYTKNWGYKAYIKDMGLAWGEPRVWGETDSPMRVSTYITYSTNEDLSASNSIRTAWYVRKVIPLARPVGGYYGPTANIGSLTDNFDKSLFFTCGYY